MQFLHVLRRLATLALVLVSLAPLTRAATPAQYQATVDALSRAHAAVVGIEVQVAEGARSAESLGQERSGSGVLISRDGLILTIGYLMLEADSIQVTTQGNKKLPAKAVAYDPATGFGLIRSLLPLRGIQPAPLGNAAQARVGDTLLVSVGDGGGDVSVTELVSKRPFSGYWEYHIETGLFTSPPVVNHSGAALFNQKGELLGIGSLIVGDALGQGHRSPGNMFVPVDLLKPILSELQRNGSSRLSRRPWLGLHSAEESGQVQIIRVNKESPAEAAGLAEGDLVLAVDGARVSSLENFYKKIWAHTRPDDEIRLTIRHSGQTRDVTVKGVDRMSTIKKPAGI